jgi:hypothetical protein
MKKIVFRSGYYLQKRSSTCKDNNPFTDDHNSCIIIWQCTIPPTQKKTKTKTKNDRTSYPPIGEALGSSVGLSTGNRNMEIIVNKICVSKMQTGI